MVSHGCGPSTSGGLVLLVLEVTNGANRRVSVGEAGRGSREVHVVLEGRESLNEMTAVRLWGQGPLEGG